jgi:glycosyltransferase involved in cell wall biosynthesis
VQLKRSGGNVKVSILLPDLRGGGAERVNIDLAHEFARAGYEVEFVLRQARGEFLEEARKAFPVTDLAVPRVRFLLPKLVSYLKMHRPDFLIAAMWPLTVIAPIAQHIARSSCRVLVSEHGMLSAQYRDWGVLHRAVLRVSTGIGYRLADHRVGVSTGLIQDMASLSRMRIGRFHVIHNPVPSHPEPSAETVRDAASRWCSPRGARIVTVGSMKAVKNQPLLLRAFAQLDFPNARLMFVGDGAEREALLSLAEELGVADRVILAGFQPDPTPFYKTADLFVLSSDYEGFGNVIVEALACGTPVVSTDCPSGPGEILDHGRFGRLVPVGDANALANAIREALEAPVDRDALKNRAAEFSPEIAARKYLDLLDI